MAEKRAGRRAVRRAEGRWSARGARAGSAQAPAAGMCWRQARAPSGCYTGYDKPHMPPRQKCACVRGAPATVRGAADGGGGHAGMRSERATTTVHRLGHGSLATPRHDVAWTATVWGAMTQIGAIGGAAAAGRGGGSGVGARALDGAGLLACGVCRAAHQYTNRTHLRFLPVSPSSPESEKTLCAIAWPVGVRPLPPYTEAPNGASKDG